VVTESPSIASARMPFKSITEVSESTIASKYGGFLI
jgi:hypothetical protein